MTPGMYIRFRVSTILKHTFARCPMHVFQKVRNREEGRKREKASCDDSNCQQKLGF